MITPEKKLRAGRSVWGAVTIAHSPLRASIKVDVAIVGAGVSGAFMAEALSQHYESVAVLDRREPGQGSTQASTAMLQFEIDVPLIELRGKIGPQKAARAWRRSFRATQNIVRLVRDENIRCGLERRGALYLAGNDMGARDLEKECKARNRAGVPGEFLDKAALRCAFGIERTGAIISPKSAVANPVQLTAGLLRRAVRTGARIYSPVDIKDVMATSHGVVLDAGSHFIEARHVIFCTGYELLKGLPKKGTKVTSSWAMATPPRAFYPAWLDKVVVWEASTPYLYLRTTPDKRVIIGGEDEDIDFSSYRVRSLPRKTSRLIAKTTALIPDLNLRAAYSWTGAFGESENGMPFIDTVPGMPGCFAVMGFGGNGTIYSKIAAELMPGLLKGRPPQDADLYQFRDS